MKERFFSLPGCARNADPSLVVGPAGWNAMERSRAVAAWLIARKEQDGWPAARLLPLLAALRELLPWVRQRHDAPDPDYGRRHGRLHRRVHRRGSAGARPFRRRDPRVGAARAPAVRRPAEGGAVFAQGSAGGRRRPVP